MEKYKNRAEYENDVKGRSKLPMGFQVGVVPLEFYPEEKKVDAPLGMKLSMIYLDEKTSSFAGVFTKNSLPGHPIVHGREMLKSSFVQGVLINNKVSNVRCSDGLKSIDNILGGLGEAFNIDKNLFFSSSTGIIGWKLPEKEILMSVKQLPNNLSRDSVYPIAEGIMTTDNFPKVRSIELGKGRIVAVAKGAGMIEPNMATMLLFILTDIKIERDVLQNILKSVVDKTFNRISIDSDQSTSDTGLIFSSNIVDGISSSEFEDGLFSVCSDLSQDVVRNGEGTAHVIEVKVQGAKTIEDAEKIGKAIINAPLLKAAIYGNDPNLGRLLQAIGDVTGSNGIYINPETLTLSIGGDILYDKGIFILNETLELKMSNYLRSRMLSEKAIGYPEHRNNVIIVVDLHIGNFEATVYGSDLSYEYVRENADYRS